MIQRLRRKFILISVISVLLVVVLVFAAIFALSLDSMNRNLDILADTVSDGGGRFPPSFDGGRTPEGKPPAFGGDMTFITPETPYATRHFTVLFDTDGQVEMVNTDAIYSVSEKTAVEYAKRVLDGGKARGWLDSYRYKTFTTDMGRGAVFIDGSSSRTSLMQSTTISGFVLLGCASLVIILIMLLSKRAVKPIAESYEKQKQFVTDANHELKTPLTLILTNVDIAEAELGRNEWFDDIRSEGQRMAELVNQLVALSRMDEGEQSLSFTELDLSDIVSQAVAEFRPLAESKGKTVISDIAPRITFKGDEPLIRRLLSVLLDNAVKYCDNGGDISVSLSGVKRITLTVENAYSSVSDLELDRLFDRFYRADKARRFIGGYGLGLSMAKTIAENHKGEITVYAKDSGRIGFKVIL